MGDRIISIPVQLGHRTMKLLM